MVVVPFVVVVFTPLPTDRREGRAAPDIGVDVDVSPRLVGILDCAPSSVLSRDRVEPCRDGGFDPVLLAGLEFGLELPNDPPGVKPDRVDMDGFRGVYRLPPAPSALSLSLNESGVEADNEERDGRDIATDL